MILTQFCSSKRSNSLHMENVMTYSKEQWYDELFMRIHRILSNPKQTS